MKIKGRKIFANSFSSTGQMMRKRERKRERDKQVSGNNSFSNSGFLVGKLEIERERENQLMHLWGNSLTSFSSSQATDF